MRKIERVLYCESCDEGITYLGTDKEILREVRETFAKRHDHEQRERLQRRPN